MSLILGIDPGSERSGYAAIDGCAQILGSGDVENAELRKLLLRWHSTFPLETSSPVVAIEALQSYGMAVGKDVFETAMWIGRFSEVAESLGMIVKLYARPKVFRAVTGMAKGGDAALRRALLLRFGGDKKGEPLNALKGSTDKRSAFAVAVYYLDGAKLGEW